MQKSPSFDISKWSLTIREELDHSLETLDQSLLGLTPDLVSEIALTRLDVARRQVKRFKDLMENLSILIQEQEQQFYIDVAEGNFSAFMEELILPYRNFCRRHNITLRSDIGTGPEGYFAFARLSKVIETLLINAIEFCDDTDGRIHITLEYIETNKVWRLTVQDNGIGIRDEKLPHIFNPNYAGDDLHLRHFQSVSLGLFLAKTFAESLGGTLLALSETQVFSRFELTWPHAYTMKGLPFKNVRLQHDFLSTLKEATGTIQRSLFAQLPIQNGAVVDAYLIVLCAQEHDMQMRKVFSPAYTLVYCRDVASALARALYFSPRGVFICEGDYHDMPATHLARSLRLNSSTSALPVVWWGNNPPAEADQHYASTLSPDVFSGPLLAFLERAGARIVGMKTAGRSKVKSSGEQFLEKIDALIEANLSQTEFGPAELAGLLYMDRSQLHRKLKKLCNLNTSAYIRNYRLTRANEELKNGRMNISEVSAWCGFASTSYFTTCFSAFFGTKPSHIIQHK